MKTAFITGCDSRTEWQLPWFIKNFRKHMPAEELIVYDFGLKGNRLAGVDYVTLDSLQPGWFKKPSAMLNASIKYDAVCWLDTDCEVRDSIADIWDSIPPGKIGLVEDMPWSTRRGGTHYNTGVVAFRQTPPIITTWIQEINLRSTLRGDQEVLHEFLKSVPMNRLVHVHELPNKYNALRLQIQDDTLPREIRVMHWTGAYGNDEIMKQIRES